MHRNESTRWSANDIFDIDAMSLAIPYCDIVVTEQHVSHLLTTHDAGTRAQTMIVSSLAELVPLLAASG